MFALAGFALALAWVFVKCGAMSTTLAVVTTLLKMSVTLLLAVVAIGALAWKRVRIPFRLALMPSCRKSRAC